MGIVHTEALALQAKLQADAQELMAKATQIGNIVSSAIATGRGDLTEDETKLVQLLDNKAVLLGKVKAFLDSL